MLYYQGYTISFQEVPDETSLVFLVADCPHKCSGCHSPELRKAEGADLLNDIESIILKYEGAITCVCLMGEGQDMKALIRCADIINKHNLKSAIYIGSGEILGLNLALRFDYVKYGPYVKKLGGLDSPKTNQHMIHVTKRHLDSFGNPSGIEIEDITYKFQKQW